VPARKHKLSGRVGNPSQAIESTPWNLVVVGWESYPEVAGEFGVESVEEGLVVEALVSHGDLRALRRCPVAQYLDQRLLVRAPSCPKLNP
jgi:hypothetical protein